MKVISEIRLTNLEALMKRYSSVGDFNAAIGRKREDSTIRQVLKGTVFSNGYARVMGDAVAREIEANLSLARGWMDHEHPDGEASGEDCLPLPVMRVVIEGGEVKYVPEEGKPDCIFVPSGWAVKNGLRTDVTRAVVVQGGWMEPSIPAGAIVFVVPLPEGALPGDGIYLVRYFDGARVAQVRRMLDGTLLVHFANPLFPDERVPEGTDPAVFSVLGRVAGMELLRAF